MGVADNSRGTHFFFFLGVGGGGGGGTCDRDSSFVEGILGRPRCWGTWSSIDLLGSPSLRFPVPARGRGRSDPAESLLQA